MYKASPQWKRPCGEEEKRIIGGKGVAPGIIEEGSGNRPRKEDSHEKIRRGVVSTPSSAESFSDFGSVLAQKRPSKWDAGS